MKTSLYQFLAVCLLAGGVANQASAVDFHVATAQELQNALTIAAANGADDTIYLTNGYYIGNFNYNSAEARSLTIQGEVGTTNTQITIDGAGTGGSMNLSCSANGNIMVRGLTFLRNCGSSGYAGLRIVTGSGADALVEDSRFISPSGTSGMGLNLSAGQNAAVRRCSVLGVKDGGGAGVSVSSAFVVVQNCVLTTNSGYGLSASGSSAVEVTGNTFNLNVYRQGNGGGASCSGGSITVAGNTFTGNSAPDSYPANYSGGGAYCYSYSSTVTVSSNVFSGNYARGTGGGVYCESVYGPVTISGNTFAGNSAYYYGGGCHAQSSYGSGVTLSGNTFANNSASYYFDDVGGGGAYCKNYSGGSLALFGNTFTGNSSPNGGGVYCSGSTLLSNNTFTANSASYGGGARCSGSPLTVAANTFTSNLGSYGGGAYWSATSGTGTFWGNTAKQNSVGGSGGAFYVDGGTLKLLDNLVVRNQQTGSSYKGGGIWVRALALDMINNAVFGNTAVGSGGGVAFQVDGTSEVLHVYNNIIWGNSAQGNGADVHLAGTGSRKEFMFNDTHGMYGVWDIAQNLLDVDPQFFDPVNGDYHLRGTSPCKDAGTNGAPSLPDVDMDGGARIADGTVDLGCYEFATAATHPADVNTNFVMTAAEFADYAAAWKAGQTWSNAPVVIPADYVTRAGYLMTNGGAYHNDGSARPVNWKPGP